MTIFHLPLGSVCCSKGECKKDGRSPKEISSRPSSS
jgi:hypothetical protein